MCLLVGCAASLGSWISVDVSLLFTQLNAAWLCVRHARVCARTCVWESEWGEREKVESEPKRERDRDPRRMGFLPGLWLFLHHYPNCRQSLLMSLFPLPIHTLTHSSTPTDTRTHIQCTVCVNRGWGSPAQGRKEEIRERRRRRGCRERRMENRFMKWSIPNSTICLLWETPFINHHTAAENRAFGRVLVCVFVCVCTRVCVKERERVGESFIPVAGFSADYSGRYCCRWCIYVCVCVQRVACVCMCLSEYQCEHVQSVCAVVC